MKKYTNLFIEYRKYSFNFEEGIDYLKSLYKLKENDFRYIENLIIGQVSKQVFSAFLASKGLSDYQIREFLDISNF